MVGDNWKSTGVGPARPEGGNRGQGKQKSSNKLKKSRAMHSGPGAGGGGGSCSVGWSVGVVFTEAGVGFNHAGGSYFLGGAFQGTDSPAGTASRE